MADEKILDKLGKIKAHMDSAKEIGNEAEAQAFATMLQNLLAKYKLEMTDIEYSTHIKEEPIGQFMAGGGTVISEKGKRVYRNQPSLEVQGRRIHWQEELAGVIARAHSCLVAVSPGTAVIWFIGRPSSVQVVDYLYLFMVETAEKLAHKAYMQFRRQLRKAGKKDVELTADLLKQTHGFKASFLKSFTRRLYERFNEEKVKMEKDNSGTALMRINKEEQDVREYVNNMGAGKAKMTRGSRGGNVFGHERGRATADSLDISRSPSERLEE